MTEEIVLAGGCFWCTEAIFQRLHGVTEVVAGYSGGEKTNQTYTEVCSGKTGHAEAVRIVFENDTIDLEKILEIFFLLHDPTSRNQQDYDIGTEYRSAIFYLNEEQRRIAEKIKDQINGQKIYSQLIVTEIKPLKNFYPAEDYHQNFYRKNREASYCQLIIDPKIKKLIEKFSVEVK